MELGVWDVATRFLEAWLVWIHSYQSTEIEALLNDLWPHPSASQNGDGENGFKVMGLGCRSHPRLPIHVRLPVAGDHGV